MIKLQLPVRSWKPVLVIIVDGPRTVSLSIEILCTGKQSENKLSFIPGIITMILWEPGNLSFRSLSQLESLTYQILSFQQPVSELPSWGSEVVWRWQVDSVSSHCSKRRCQLQLLSLRTDPAPITRKLKGMMGLASAFTKNSLIPVTCLAVSYQGITDFPFISWSLTWGWFLSPTEQGRLATVMLAEMHRRFAEIYWLKQIPVYLRTS